MYSATLYLHCWAMKISTPTRVANYNIIERNGNHGKSASGFDRHSRLDLVDGRFAAAECQISESTAAIAVATRAERNQFVGDLITRGEIESRPLSESPKMDCRGGAARR